MSKTTAISIVIGFILLLGGGLAYWYYTIGPKNPSQQNPQTNTGGNNLFPFGNTNQSNNGTTSTSTNQTVVSKEPSPQVRKVSATPIAGFSPLNDKTLGASVRYMEVETGNIYEAPLQVLSTRRISNTTIPKVRSVLWLPQARAFIAQYLGGDDETIQSFYGDINPPQNEGQEGNVTGKFMDDGITALASLTPFSASTTLKNPGKIFYLKNITNGAEGFSALQNGSKPTSVFNSPLSEWLLLNSGGDALFLQTKSSALASSYLFSLNPSTGALSKVLGNIVGLSSLPNQKGDMVLYSETLNKKPLLHLYNVGKNTFQTIPLNTFADKCAWLESTTTKATNSSRIYCGVPSLMLSQVLYPDSWYQGKTTFNDDIWEINPTTLELNKLVPLVDSGSYLDVWNPSLSSDSAYFIFINKRDLTLWSIKLRG
jgi:hypothetical protein